MKKISDVVFPVYLRLPIAFFALFYASFNLYAVEGTQYWQNIDPEGGRISHFITHQNYPEVIYASSSVGTYFKSNNGGESWVALPYIYNSMQYFPFGLEFGLAVDSVSPHILFAYSSEGLLKSTDNALHWQLLGGDLDIEVSSFFALNKPVTQFLSILINTENYFEHGVAISQNGGLQWYLTDMHVDLRSEDNTEVTIVARDMKNPGIVYGVVYWAGDFTPPSPFEDNLYKSADGGLSWVNITAPEKKYKEGFIISPDDSEKLYATFSGMAMISLNGGESWALVGNATEGSVGFNITRVYIDPADPRVLYAKLAVINVEDRKTHSNRIAKSYDAGETWRVIDVSPNIPGGEITINTGDNQKLLMAAGQDQGILRSENGGQDWVLSNSGMNIVGNHLSVAENDDAVMYMVGDYNTYYKSIDGGQLWHVRKALQPISGDCYKILINPEQNNEIICQSYQGLYLSKDAGEHWQVLTAENNAQAMYARDGTIYLLLAGDIARSSDAGQTWKAITRITQELDAPVIPFNRKGIAPKSLPFQSVTPELDNTYKFDQLPVFDPVTPSVLYAFSSGGIFNSNDRGDSWQLLFHPQTAVFGEWKLLINPGNPDSLLFFRGSSSILQSNDGGKSWEETLEQLLSGNYTPPQVVFDPDNKEGLYGVKPDSGEVYHSADKGISWALVNKGLQGAGNVTLYASAKHVFATTRTGIFKLSEQVDFLLVADCLFQWAEHEYPDLFTPDSSVSQQWGGYTYRYYSKSNIYLGFFYEQEVHLNWADLLSKIDVAGSVGYYQELTGCH